MTLKVEIAILPQFCLHLFSHKNLQRNYLLHTSNSTIFKLINKKSVSVEDKHEFFVYYPKSKSEIYNNVHNGIASCDSQQNRLCHKFFIGSDVLEVIHKIYSDGFKYEDGKY